MIERSLSVYFFIHVVIALSILSPHSNGLSFVQIALYADIYIFSCAIAGVLLWKNKKAGYIFALIPSLSQVIRPIGERAWLDLPPPISLGLPFGDFSAGKGFVVDVLAIGLSVFLIYGLVKKSTHYKIDAES